MSRVEPAWTVAFYEHAKSTAPLPRRLSWGGLVKTLTTFRPPTDPKSGNPMWSPVRLADGATRRLAASVEAVTCIVLDFDSGVGADEARAPWMDCRHIVHTSYSHTDDVPKFRIVVPMESPIVASTWLRVWHWASSRVGGQNDGACKDVGRAYFLPVARGPYWSVVHEGPVLNVVPSQLPPSPGERAAKPAPRPPVYVHGDQDRAIHQVLSTDPEARRAVATFLGATFLGNNPQSAKFMPCPKCGDRSVWFFIDITTMRSARCHHKQCGWYGTVAQLSKGEA